MIWTKDSAQDYLLNLPQEEIKAAAEFIVARLDCSLALLKNFGIDGETLDALNFLQSLPSLPMSYTEDEKPYIDKLNAVVKILRNNPVVWYNIGDLPHEIWRDIVDYETLYKVSNYGRIKNCKETREKILYGKIAENGYLRYCLTKNNAPKNFRIHRLVAQVFLPNPENKATINHKSEDGDKKNNCVWNLEWATQRENVIHAFQVGLNWARKGAENGLSKFTAEQVRWIREHHIPYDKEFGTIPLAKRFGVSCETIQCIVHGRRYTNVI